MNINQVLAEKLEKFEEDLKSCATHDTLDQLGMRL